MLSFGEARSWGGGSPQSPASWSGRVRTQGVQISASGPPPLGTAQEPSHLTSSHPRCGVPLPRGPDTAGTVSLLPHTWAPSDRGSPHPIPPWQSPPSWLSTISSLLTPARASPLQCPHLPLPLGAPTTPCRGSSCAALASVSLLDALQVLSKCCEPADKQTSHLDLSS